MTTSDSDRQLLTESYQRAKERHEDSFVFITSEQLRAIGKAASFIRFTANNSDSMTDAAKREALAIVEQLIELELEIAKPDLRIIADERDRRNDLDKPKSLAQTPTNSAKD